MNILSNGFCDPTAAPDRRQYPFARIRGQKVKPLEDFGDEPHRGKILWDIPSGNVKIAIENHHL